MTTEQFIEDLEKRKAAADAVFRSFDADAHGPAGLNPVVADALEEQKNAPVSPEPSVTPSGKEGTVNVKLGGALKGVTLPFTPGVAEAKPATEKEPEYNPMSIYDLLLRNEEVRKRASENWERNERSNRARTAIAAVSDALSSLGNLVGTTLGAPNQEQTYQTPLISAQGEQDRTYARALAERLRGNEDTYLLTKMKLDAAESGYDREMAKQEAMTQRALALAGLRSDLAAQNAGYKSEQIAQQGEIRKDVARMNNESAEKRTGITAGTSRANALTRDAFNRDKLEAQKNGEISSGGGVSGYETRTEIQRDALGNETGRTTRRVPTGGGGGTRSSGGGSGSSGSSGGNGGKKAAPYERSQGQKKKKKVL